MQADFRNMQEYLSISIDQMSEDFERIRQHLQIEKWLVFGGSWGSTLGTLHTDYVCMHIIYSNAHACMTFACFQ